MKENRDDSLFAELTPEESASVNGASCHRYYSDRYYRSSRYNRYYDDDDYYSRRRVYRRNYDGSFRIVYRSW